MRVITMTLITIVIGATLTACSSPTDIGKPRSIDGGTQIVVPALWANGRTNSGGIEPATVWVDTNRSSDELPYEVNLTDVEAKGGGTQWRAATSSAAAIGTLLSGYDPDNIAYRFDITGPIDGPSAGAILTVGVLAAINRHSLKQATTMTGTISPDGTIGPVGLIGQKLTAASAAGYNRALIPAMLTTFPDPETGDRVDTTSFARHLGIEVTFVGTIAEAYKAFTGKSLVTDGHIPTYSFTKFPSLDQARADAALGLQREIEQLLSAHPAAPAGPRAQLRESQEASSRGDWSTAFGLAADTLDQFGQWQGETSFERTAAARGLEAARTQLRLHVEQQLTEINLQITRVASEAESLNTSQRLALPGALGWLTYSRAVLESMLPDLVTNVAGVSTAQLTDYSGLAEEVILEAAVLFPHIMSVLRATPVDELKSRKEVASFISGYTNFLVVAGNSNLEYLRAVKGLNGATADHYSVLDLVPVADQLRAEAAAIRPETESIAIEMEQSSTAMTYFVVTTSLVTSLEVFGSPDLWLNPQDAVIRGNAFLEDSIEHSDELVRSASGALLNDGMNAGFPRWSAEWGTESYAELAAQDRSARGASVALNELWYDVITVMSMRAYVTPE